MFSDSAFSFDQVLKCFCMNQFSVWSLTFSDTRPNVKTFGSMNIETSYSAFIKLCSQCLVVVVCTCCIVWVEMTLVCCVNVCFSSTSCVLWSYNVSWYMRSTFYHLFYKHRAERNRCTSCCCGFVLDFTQTVRLRSARRNRVVGETMVGSFRHHWGLVARLRLEDVGERHRTQQWHL